MQSDVGSPRQAGAISGPKFVAVGHVTRDLTPSGDRLGGTAAYAARTAARLGLDANLVTRAAPFAPLDALRTEVTVHNAGSPHCTTFENVYEGAQRRQYLHARAQPIAAQDIPSSLRQSPIALFGPVAQEIQPDLLDCASSATVRVVVPQGWLRAWNEDGAVQPVAWRDAEAIRGRCDVLVLSVDDLEREPQSLDARTRLAPLVVITRGRNGADVYADARLIYWARAYRANEVDPTGAGDVFAAAFAIGLQQRGDPVWAADFAGSAAAFAVEGPGSDGIATAEQVLERMAAGDRVGVKRDRGMAWQ
ncbi:MAG: ribokinase [Dehalococcoidia bacterium]|nr:ribokinase [Dehalococcoidia bacterium]